ncbi:hypothetical protein P4O66_010151, partial [Electrophorus voltai]
NDRSLMDTRLSGLTSSEWQEWCVWLLILFVSVCEPEGATEPVCPTPRPVALGPLQENQLYDPNQSGYKPAHSTETALIAVTEKVRAAKTVKLSPVLILLDLLAAFDTVNQNILLSVLSRLGVIGSAWKWFQSYMEGWSYQVSSRIAAYMTDIASRITAHHLKLNPSKTELLYIPGTPNPYYDLTVSFENSLVSPSKAAHSLGITLDNQLSFSTHASNLTQSCRFILYNIQRIQPFLSQETAQALVQSLVMSKLDYCNLLLAALPPRAIRSLQCVHNAAA